MNLFLDTNIWLSFFHFSSDDLEELRKLTVLIREGKVRLLLPDQVVNEFSRNRETKIRDAMKLFTDDKPSNQYPQFCRDYDEYEKIIAVIREYKRLKSALVEEVESACREESFLADKVIRALFSKADRIEISDDILNAARRRYELGNPPGKRGSLGDAVNWECLLTSVPDGENLYLVAADKDYSSVGDLELFSPYLKQEWERVKLSKVIYFRSMAGFFRGTFPDIKLASQLEKNLLISRLASSGSFSETRSTLRRLARNGDFTRSQVQDIVAAALSNNQVYWILGDSDICELMEGILRDHEGTIDLGSLKRLRRYMKSEGDDQPDPSDEDLSRVLADLFGSEAE